MEKHLINQARLVFLLLSVVIALLVSGCSVLGSTAGTPAGTRVATQTPWVIYVPVTLTPEPATVTPFPTVTGAAASVRATATRTPTRASAATKAPVPATKPPVASTAPTTAAVVPTSAPACTTKGVTLLFPENGAPRNTRKDGSGGSAFIMKWTPFQSGDSDLQMGYQVVLSSKRAGFSNGATVYVSHNKFLQDGQQFTYDQRAVSTLASGESVMVSWFVTVVRTSGTFDNQGGVTGSVVNCSAPSQTFTISLIVND